MTNSRIYIGNLPNGYKDDELASIFEKYGEITEVNIKTGRQGGCFGFISFGTAEAAESAVQSENGQELGGRSIRVEPTHTAPHPRGGYRRDYRGGGGGDRVYRLKVEGLPHRTSWQDLKDRFRIIGNVSYTNVEGDVGVVEFPSLDLVQAAIDQLDGTPLSPRDPSVNMRLTVEDPEGVPAKRPARVRGVDRMYDWRDRGDSPGRGGYDRYSRGYDRGYDRDRGYERGMDRSYDRDRGYDRRNYGRDDRGYDRGYFRSSRRPSFDRHEDRRRRYESDDRMLDRSVDRYDGPVDRYSRPYSPGRRPDFHRRPPPMRDSRDMNERRGTPFGGDRAMTYTRDERRELMRRSDEVEY